MSHPLDMCHPQHDSYSSHSSLFLISYHEQIHRLEDVDFPTASRLHNQLLAWLENNGPQYTPIARRSNIDKMVSRFLRLVCLFA